MRIFVQFLLQGLFALTNRRSITYIPGSTKELILRSNGQRGEPRARPLLRPECGGRFHGKIFVRYGVLQILERRKICVQILGKFGKCRWCEFVESVGSKQVCRNERPHSSRRSTVQKSLRLWSASSSTQRNRAVEGWRQCDTARRKIDVNKGANHRRAQFGAVEQSRSTLIHSYSTSIPSKPPNPLWHQRNWRMPIK